MKRKIITLTVILAMLINLFSAFDFSASAAVNINIGDYIEMGEYYGKPILWRCVSFEKISGYDTSGNPIIDSTDTRTTYAEGYLPLMLSDRILCLKAFDASGTNISGSHNRGQSRNNIQGYFRQLNGSNYWGDSNIRDWLNSEASAGNVVWNCGNPPDENHVWSGYNEYSNEPGFLTGFTPSELKCIKKVTQDSLLDECEYSNMLPYGSKCHSGGSSISSVVQNAETTAYRERVTDRIFLPDVVQINKIYQNDALLGGNSYYIGIPTEKAVENSDYKSSSLAAADRWSCLLRSPLAIYGKLSTRVRDVNSSGSVSAHTAYYGDGGVRPAFFLNSETTTFIYGNGTESNPYRMINGGSNKLLNAMNATPATEYNNKLAEIAAQLSLLTYVDGLDDDTSLKNFLVFDYGFDRSNIRSYSADADGNVISGYGGERSMAFTIATKEAEREGGDNLMVIVCQGSTDFYEFIKDATALPSKNFKGYYAYDIVWDFYNNVYRKLSRFLDGKHYKVLITGHSLGGAAGNLVAADMITTGKKMFDVYCYTFGSINSIASVVPVQRGYERIHNVYNLFDTFSPYQFGLRLPTGMGAGYGKFGKMEMYARDYRAPIQIGLPALVQMGQHVNHDLDKYIDAIENNYVLNSKFRNTAYTISACPVDIDVYCEGVLVGRVVNNEVDESVTSIDISVNDDVKFIVYPDDRHYDIKITAFDEGEMVYSTFDPADGNVKMMTNVALSDGKTMTSEVSGEIDASETQLLVVDENNDIISKVQSDGTESEVNKNEIVFGNTDLINTGEKILISSVIENFTEEEAGPMDIIAALYYDDAVVDIGVYHDVTVPVNREIRRAFELDCPEEYREGAGRLRVKLLYWNLSQMMPIRGACEFLTEQPSADASD